MENAYIECLYCRCNLFDEDIEENEENGEKKCRCCGKAINANYLNYKENWRMLLPEPEPRHELGHMRMTAFFI